MQLILLPALVLLMYLLLVRPQQQRVRRQRALVTSLQPGDEVVTAGGMVGVLRSLDDSRATVEVADGVVLSFLPPAITGKAPAVVGPGPGPSAEPVRDVPPAEDVEPPRPDGD